MGDLDGRNILITGANTGIGRATALALAPRGASLWLACRSLERTQPVLDELSDFDVHFLPLDLGSLESVRACAAEFLSDADRPLHVLINNAGLVKTSGLTADGVEMTFGVNHLGHFLLTELLLDRIEASTPARIVNVASEAHYGVDAVPWDSLREPGSATGIMDRYRVSKFANVLYAKELARRLEGSGVTTYSLHPGVVATDVWRVVPGPLRWLIKRFMISSEEGAETTIHCATSPDVAGDSGLYYDSCAVKDPDRRSLNPELWTEIVDKSWEMVGGRPD